MASPRTSPPRRLLTYAWRVPLLCIPLALFFGTLFGRGQGLGGYLFAYRLALVFSAIISLAIWAVEVWVAPALRRRPGWNASTLNEGIVYMTAAVVATFVAGLVVRATVFPGFLGSPRGVALFGMFTLLFAGLFTGIAMVGHYHRSSIEHARAEKELELARTIQRSFLPESFPAGGRVEVHAVNVPSRRVSGDFYDVVPTEAGLVLAVADVEGKSIPASPARPN